MDLGVVQNTFFLVRGHDLDGDGGFLAFLGVFSGRRMQPREGQAPEDLGTDLGRVLADAAG